MIERPFYEEHNVGQLALISIMSRLPEKHQKSWTSDMIVGNVPGTIKCFSAHEHLGVPHGFDNDVSMALHTLYMMTGCPLNGRVSTTAADLLKLIGMDNSPQYKQALETSLKRLHYAHYEIEAQWYFAAGKNRHRGYRGGANFTYLSDFSLVEELNPSKPATTQMMLNVTVNEKVRNSLTFRHIVTLRYDILSQLARYSPTTRAVYRILETIRYDPSDITRNRQSVRLYAHELASMGRILGDDISGMRVMRFFHKPLMILRALNYLKSYDLNGRGANLYVDLEFTNAETSCDARSYALMIQNGVWDGAATLLAAKHSFDCIQDVVEQLSQNGQVESMGPYLTKVLKNNDAGSAIYIAKGGRKATRVKTIAPAKAAAPEPVDDGIPDDTVPLAIAIIRIKPPIHKVISASVYRRLEAAVARRDMPEEQIRQFLKDPSDEGWEHLEALQQITRI